MYPWKTLKIFVSSTFKDLELERDKLAKVFYNIQQEIFARRLHLISYDLRWRDREEASIVQWCLNMVQECHYFVGIIGYRYGFRPQTDDLGLKNEENISITEMEINKALDTIPKEKRFFCIGNLSQYKEKELSSEDQKDIESIKLLRERLENAGETVFSYKNTEEVLKHIYEHLQKIIDAEFPLGTKVDLKTFNREEALQEIIEEKKKGFVGRHKYLQILEKFCMEQEEKNIFAIHAVAGTGKSALLAQFISDWQQKNPQTPIIAHYMSMAGNSRSVQGIMSSISEQLRKYNLISEIAEYEVVHEVRQTLMNLKEKVIVVLDGLDEVDQDAQDLSWLPNLPPQVRLIITTRPVGSWEILEKRSQLSSLELPLLSSEEISAIVSNYEQQKGLNLTKEDQESLIRRAAGNPLFLKVALDEMAEGGIAVGQIAETVDGLFHQILQRLQKEYGEKVIEDYLGLIAAGRGGVAEAELESIIVSEHHQKTWENFIVRIHKAFANFIVKREGLYNFFHPEFERSVKMFLGKSGMREAHSKLSDYFLVNKYSYERSVFELPYQLQWSERYPELLAILTDLKFLETKCFKGMFNSLLEDFHRSLYNETVRLNEQTFITQEKPPCKITRETLRLITRALELDIQFIRRHPKYLFQSLWNRCYWHDCPTATYYYTKDIIKMDTPWKKNENELIYKVAERWRYEKKSQTSFLPWIRSKRPLPQGLDSPLLRILQGHTGKVNSVAFSTNATEVVSGGDDNILRLWSVNTGEIFLQNDKHHKKINSVAFSSDGDVFASAGNDNVIYLWSVSRKKNIGLCNGHTLPITSVVFHPTKNEMASCSHDMSIRLWDTNGNCTQTLTPQDGYVWAVVYDKEGKNLASAHHTGNIHVWCSETNQPKFVLKGHKGTVYSIVFTPNNHHLISAGEDQTIRVWSLGTGMCLRILKGHTQLVSGLAIHPNGETLYSVSWDKTMRMWKLPEGQCISSFQAHETEVRNISISKDGKKIVTCGAEGSVRIWTSEKGNMYPFKGHDAYIFNLDFTPDGQEISTGEGDKICVWSSLDGKCSKIIAGRYRTLHKSVENEKLFVVQKGQEIVVLPKQGRKIPLGYFPAIMKKMEMSPTRKVIAGYFGNYVYILELITD